MLSILEREIILSYQVLARKWRPKNFNDVKGQDHITRTLVNSIKNQKIAHAYLLTGTRGIGKTTIARIFARAIRCENLSTEGNPCLKCDSCISIESGHSLDYLEVDGASNNSVDDMRDLIENVQYLPTNGKYKVYVIDEVHMLTVSAFNALLKTLEEPPEHVVFIFATTDPQKLLGTVLSRCQRFDFKNSSPEDTKKLLLEVAEKEGITFESENLALELAKQGKGSFRDSLSLFDQVISLSSTSVITEEALMLSLGMAKTKSINVMVNNLLAKNKDAVIEIYNQVLNENIDLKIFSKQVLDKFYNLLVNIDSQGNLETSDLNPDVIQEVSLVEILWIYENLSKDLEWALNSFDPEKTCSVAFIKAALREQILNLSSEKISLKKNSNSIEETIKVEAITEELVTKPTIDLVVTEKEAPETIEKISVEDVKIEDVKSEEVEEKEIVVLPISWEVFLKFLYRKNATIAVNLERGNLLNHEDFKKVGSYLKVAFSQECRIFFDFLSDQERKNELIELAGEYLGHESSDVHISFEMMDDETKETTNFMSSVEIEEDGIRKNNEELKQNILNNKYIKTAETLFNSKIERVVLNDEE
ncbi:MAG: DNA polymerase-3 subunit gamma/tau [Bacteriovoracaceae bacterium]